MSVLAKEEDDNNALVSALHTLAAASMPPQPAPAPVPQPKKAAAKNASLQGLFPGSATKVKLQSILKQTQSTDKKDGVP